MMGQTQGRKKGLSSCSGAGKHSTVEAFWQGSFPEQVMQAVFPPCSSVGWGQATSGGSNASWKAIDP